MFENPLAVAWNVDAVVAVLWLGLLGSGAAYLLMFRLLTRIGATATSQLAYLLPVVGIITGALMFGEAIDARIVVGTGLILGGVALVDSKFGERRIWGRRAPGEPSRGRGRRREAAASEPQRLIAYRATASRIAPTTTSPAAAIRVPASRRPAASRSRIAPHAAASTIPDSRSGATVASGAIA